MRITKYLAFRLFLIVLLVMLVSAVLFTTMMLNWHSEKYLNITKDWALRTSDLIKRSMRYSMMENRREDIYQTINTLGSEAGHRSDSYIQQERGSHFFHGRWGNRKVCQHKRGGLQCLSSSRRQCAGESLPATAQAVSREFSVRQKVIVFSESSRRSKTSRAVTPPHVMNILLLKLCSAFSTSCSRLKNLDEDMSQLRNSTYVTGALMVVRSHFVLRNFHLDNG